MQLYVVTKTLYVGFHEFLQGQFISADDRLFAWCELAHPRYADFIRPVGIIETAFLNKYQTAISDILSRHKASPADIKTARRILTEILAACGKGE